MQNKNLEKEAKLILDIVKEEIRNKKDPSLNREDFKNINWSLLKEMAIYHDLTPFAYMYLKSFSFALPQKLMSFLKNEYYFSQLNNVLFKEEFLRLNRLFIEKDLIMVPIKGSALLEDIYKKNTARPMIDIDILVRESELEKAEALLIESGYEKFFGQGNYLYWRNKNCDIPFKKKGGNWLLELHFAIDLKRFNRNILPDLWKRFRPLSLDGNQIKILSPEDTLFSLALHQRRFGKRLVLKNVLDVALLMQKYKDGFDWDYVIKEAKAGRMCAAIFFVLFQADTLLDTVIPQDVWKALKVPSWKKKLMYVFITRDTFSPAAFRKFQYIYLKNHFLLYENLWEPILFILNIPQEQFAKFYNLKPYEKKTELAYKFRLFYIIYRTFIVMGKRILGKGG